jgi:hypothetical protein
MLKSSAFLFSQALAMLKYYRGSFVFMLVALLTGWLLGGWEAAWIVFVLAALETSLSFDNAVVNAKVLLGMNPVWRKRFLVWGMIIAVFVMRLVFPLLIVGVVAHLGPLDVLKLAIYDEHRYAAVLTGAHVQIAAFGGAFLSLVFLKFFIDEEKDTHWFGPIERQLTRLGKLNAVEIGITLLVILLSASALAADKQLGFMVAGLWGVIVFVVADGIGDLLGSDAGAQQMAKQGLAGFMYLEILDASFSFDGVIGAFALSHNLFIIALGLGVGAFFVRSFTLMLVDLGTLTNYRYLEHGAFWAIGALAAILFASVSVEVPEALTGGLGLALIALSFWSSVLHRKRQLPGQ